MSLSCTVTEIFSGEYWGDLEMWIRGSFKIIENGDDQ